MSILFCICQYLSPKIRSNHEIGLVFEKLTRKFSPALGNPRRHTGGAACGPSRLHGVGDRLNIQGNPINI